MVDKPEDYSDLIDRRRFIELAGVSGAAALAGCGGDDTTTEDGGGMDTTTEDGSGGDDTTTEDGGMEVVDATHVGATNQAPSDIQYNTYNPAGFSQIGYEIIFDKFARYNFADSEWVAEGLDSWEYTGDAFEMTVREDLTWANGDDVTAEDLKVQMDLRKKLGSAYASYAGEIETDGDYTVIMNLDGDVSPSIVEFDVLANEWIQAPQSVFQEYLDNFDSMEEDAAAQEVQDFSWNEPVASGPFAFDSASGSQLQTSRREDSPWSSNINFSNYNFNFIDGNQAMQQALLNLDVDSIFSLAATARIIAQFPDAVEQVKTPSLWGWGIIPQHDHKHMGDRAVRQAVAYAVDRETCVQNSQPLSKSPPEYPMGIAPATAESALGDNLSNFETYGMGEKQVDKAAQVLEQAGYSQDGGTWKDDNGSEVSLPLVTPAGWTDWTAISETVVDHLSNAGFAAELDTRNFGTLLDTVWPNGDYVLSAGGWNAGAPQGALPYFSLHHQLIENFRGFGYSYPSANESRGGSNADISVPEVGDVMGDDAMTVNPADRIGTLATTGDEELAQEIITEQAWVTNVDLPMIPIAEKQEQSWLTTDEWDIPEPTQDTAEANVRWPVAALPRYGMMNYDG